MQIMFTYLESIVNERSKTENIFKFGSEMAELRLYINKTTGFLLCPRIGCCSDTVNVWMSKPLCVVE